MRDCCRHLLWPLVGLSIAVFPTSTGAAAPACGGLAATTVSDAVRIAGTPGRDVILAGPGDNAIYGLGGNDVICAGAGRDTVFGGRGSDDLAGGRGEDLILGETGNDGLDGGPGAHDQVDGGPGDDSISGGAGAYDVLSGGPGNDSVDGGGGVHDIASYRAAGGPIAADLGAGTILGAEDERLTGVEDVVGGSGDDTLTGSDQAPNRLDGGPGDDRLVAAGSGDRAFGGPGADDCEGSLAAKDSCGAADAAPGTVVELYESIADTSSLVIVGSNHPNSVLVSRSPHGYTVESRAEGVRVRLGDRGSTECRARRATNSISCRGEVTSILARLGAGADTFVVSTDVPAGIEAVIDGGKGSDKLRGGAGDDTIYAGADGDADTVAGGGGDDVIYGVNIFHPRHDSGAATMLGGAGDDLLIGGQPCDADLFDGGPGDTDSASFARVRNSGTFVQAGIGGLVLDPDVGGCAAGRIAHNVEKIEGSPGPDVLSGDGGANTLLGRGGDDLLDGRGGAEDGCVGGRGSDQAVGCETVASVP